MPSSVSCSCNSVPSCRATIAAPWSVFLALDTLGSAHARSELRSLRETLTARGEPAPEALQQGLSLLERTDLRRALPQLARPSLWIAGQRDRLVPAAGMHAAAALSPHAQALPLPAAATHRFLVTQIR